MHLARIKKTLEPIEAEELRFIKEDEMPEFICADENCAVNLIPASYKPHNKQRPHFRTLKNKDHTTECKFSIYTRILELGGKRKITFEEFENLPVPTKLIKSKTDKDDETIKVNLEEDINEEDNIIKRTGSTGDFDEGGNNFKSVTTISQIVDFYLSCPFNRDIELSLFDKTKPYMYWFKRLKNTLYNKEPQEFKIYYGQLYQSSTMNSENENIIRLKMYDCEGWDDINKEQINPMYVSIKKNKLSKIKLTKIKNEILFAKEEQLDSYKKNKKDKKKPFVFFIGQKTNDSIPYEYEVLEGYLVARYTEIKKTVED